MRQLVADFENVGEVNKQLKKMYAFVCMLLFDAVVCIPSLYVSLPAMNENLYAGVITWGSA